jgi:predicted nucleotidyltransferase
LRLRDRDAIVTREGLIFRVLGYAHPSNACICDIEYAPANLFKSDNPKAPRGTKETIFYKFYEDEGWKFIKHYFPQYLIFHEALSKEILGVKHCDIAEFRKPEVKLEKLIARRPEDELESTLQNVVGFVTRRSSLSPKDFGVFGSILHNFYHPKLSDIDLIVYGRNEFARLRETLKELYADNSSLLANEFKTETTVRGKHWHFQNLSPKEFVWHQRRKMIYALFKDTKSRRTVKTEFEPVKAWKEISNDYDPLTRIVHRGWVRMLGTITEDADAPFIPSVYGIDPLEVLHGADEAWEARNIVSYMEEFRMQAQKGEVVYVEGNLEEVTTSKEHFHQITLTYCPRYYEQVLKVEPRNCSMPKP